MEERYEQAIDAYLTCLVVAQQERKLAPDTDADTNEDTQSQSVRYFVSLRHE
jgi:hypothetical protein